jgi:hypothetical protein
MLKKYLNIFCLLILSSCCHKAVELKSIENNENHFSNKVKVLNIGVFHMGYTNDENITEYDEKQHEKEIQEICVSLSKFKPTLICVEYDPSFNYKLKKYYNFYRNNPKKITEFSNNEIQLLGFEIGKLSSTKKIEGFDHQLSYNYDLSEVARISKSDDYFEIEKFLNNQDEKMKIKNTLKETLLQINSQSYYDFMINYNADMLIYANSKNSFEGADEAAKFYHRNLRMFANINKIKTNKSDRILIISGAAHAAFLNEFMKRSPKYELEKLNNFLN